MATLLLVLVVVLVVAGLAFGVISLLAGDDPGLVPASPDGFARPLPGERALLETDVQRIRLDVALRGYRMDQVDLLIRRVAHDIGYKNEVIAVLEAEVDALRAGRTEDAELLRKVREDAAAPAHTGSEVRDTAGPDSAADGPGPVDDLTVQATDPATGDDSADTDPGSAPNGRSAPSALDARSASEALDARSVSEALDTRSVSEALDARSASEELPREGSLRRRKQAEVEAGDASAVEPTGSVATDVVEPDRPARD